MSERSRLFALSFAAVMATSFCFVLRALVVDDWGRAFSLSETEKGELLGVGLWPFAISIVLLSLAIDRIGFKRTLHFAGLAHLTGLAVIYVADGFWMLYWGTLIMALGNGAVEAAVNPMIAAIFPDDRPTWLNRLHAGWPAGLAVGGLMAMALTGLSDWRMKVGLMIVPIAFYIILSVRRNFPRSPRLEAGLSYRQMLADSGVLSSVVIIGLIMIELGRVFDLTPSHIIGLTALLSGAYYVASRSLGKPLYLLLVLLMIPAAITELSTDGWIVSLLTPEMDALGIQPGWLLVYTALIVFVIRLVAGIVVRMLTPLGALAIASCISAIGLYAMSASHGLAILGAATVYGVGKSFFWGTSLAVASDLFPRGGVVTINVIAGSGMLAAGIIGSVFLGTLQDQATWRGLQALDTQQGSAFVERFLHHPETNMMGTYRALDETSVYNASSAEKAQIASVQASGKMSALSTLALLPVCMTVAYLLLALWFRVRGGYRPVLIRPVEEVGA